MRPVIDTWENQKENQKGRESIGSSFRFRVVFSYPCGCLLILSRFPPARTTVSPQRFDLDDVDGFAFEGGFAGKDDGGAGEGGFVVEDRRGCQ